MMSGVRAVVFVMLASAILAETQPPATVGEKLAFLVETMGLQGARLPIMGLLVHIAMSTPITLDFLCSWIWP